MLQTSLCVFRLRRDLNITDCKMSRSSTSASTKAVPDRDDSEEESDSGLSDISAIAESSDAESIPETMKPTQRKSVDLLLIGKTGHGKSATGNSILQLKEFKTATSGASATSEVKEAWAYVGDYIVKVVDGPGVGETRLDNVAAKKDACGKMAQAMALSPNGFHALLLVYKFGSRFTEEEQDCIDMLKSIFGESIVKDYCIMIMTGGDSFDLEYEDDDGYEFVDWLTEQSGHLKKLIKECSYRCVLFRNKTRDPKVKKSQVEQLLAMVQAMKFKETRYTNEMFEGMKEGRSRLIVKAKAPLIHEEVRKGLHLITTGLKQLKQTQDSDVVNKQLKELAESVKGLLEHVKREDKETGALAEITEEITHVKILVESEKAAIEAKKKMKAEFDEKEKKMDEKEKKMNEKIAQQQREANKQRAQLEELKRQQKLDQESLALERRKAEVCKANEKVAKQQAVDLKGNELPAFATTVFVRNCENSKRTGLERDT